VIPHPASYPGSGEIIAKLVIMLEIEPAELLTAPTARNGGRSSNRGGPCVQKRNWYGRKWGLERMKASTIKQIGGERAFAGRRGNDVRLATLSTRLSHSS
jgi:hypothetical protein